MLVSYLSIILEAKHEWIPWGTNETEKKDKL